MTQTLLPGLTIMLMFLCLWMVRYPREYYDSLMFRHEWWMGFVSWFWLIGANTALVWWVKVAIGGKV